VPIGVKLGTSNDHTATKKRATNIQVQEVAVTQKVPHIVFMGVGCTEKSYRIDVFTKSAESLAPCATSNPDFIGQLTRLDMGPGRTGVGVRNKGRCRNYGATRVPRAQDYAEQLLLDKDVRIVVTCLDNGKTLPELECNKMSSFEPRIL
jgi:hypothetical protein